jgi:hypothetical protein
MAADVIQKRSQMEQIARENIRHLLVFAVVLGVRGDIQERVSFVAPVRVL